MTYTLTAVRKPVIAGGQRAVHQFGFTLALMCDGRFVAAGMSSVPPSSGWIWLPSRGISWILPRGGGPLRRPTYRSAARKFDAARHLRLGLVKEVVADGDLLTRAIEYADELCTRVFAVGAGADQGQLTRRIDRAAVAATTADPVELMDLSIKQPDVIEGITSFFRRRDPRSPLASLPRGNPHPLVKRSVPAGADGDTGDHATSTQAGAWDETLGDLDARRKRSYAMGGARRVAKHRAREQNSTPGPGSALLPLAASRSSGTPRGRGDRRRRHCHRHRRDQRHAGGGRAEDFTTFARHHRPGSNAKRYRVAELALRNRIPMVMLLEGAGFRPPAITTAAPPTDLLMQARCSGKVPIVTAVLGPSAGHGALVAPVSDFRVMSSQGRSSPRSPRRWSARRPARGVTRKTWSGPARRSPGGSSTTTTTTT